MEIYYLPYITNLLETGDTGHGGLCSGPGNYIILAMSYTPAPYIHYIPQQTDMYNILHFLPSLKSPDLVQNLVNSCSH